MEEEGQVGGLGGHVLSTRMRKRIAEAVDRGVPIREIARVSGISRSTVREYARRWQGGKCIPAAERKVGPEERRALLEDLEARPEASASQRRELLAKTHGCFVSDGTVLRHVRSLGYEYDVRKGIWVPSEQGAK